MGTLDDLAADIATNVWLSDDFFGEDVKFFPKGDVSNVQEFTATVDDSALEGTNEAVGDGRTNRKETGQKERHSIVVELPVTANVTFPQETSRPDLLKRVKDSTIWAAKRLLASDSATKKVLFVRGRTSENRKRVRTG